VALREIDTESAFSRAKRTYWAVLTGNKWAWLCLAICGPAVQGAGTYLERSRGPGGSAVVALFAGIIGYVAASLLVLVGLLLSVLRIQRDEARQALEDAHEVVAELTASPRVSSRCRVIATEGSPTTLRLAITNGGPQRLPTGTVINMIVPAAWAVFQPCDENGYPIRRGGLIPSDEDLPGDIPGRLWMTHLQIEISAGITYLQFFQVEAHPGAYPLAIRVIPYHRDFHRIEIPEVVP
jgi:hypothetical protein